MQLTAEFPDGEVSILGVNEVDYESANDFITDGRDLPWLQETVDQPAWSSWGVRYRDVVILDGQNLAITVYNLSDHDLAVPANQRELLDLLRDAVSSLP